ncbi:MAG: cob(I)yrinic acid a,c-diamide adenosyltransferase [Bacteroidetes bacterium]|jgi:cob(I)alamin adenosyltransferase|nr:cob(I)yrinic acid a,c-diamide adenosyltransferase [Bacteroidota bacterium]
MKIYTKTGDLGATSLYGGRRVDKDDARIEAYGTVDELNAQLGVVRALPLPQGTEELLERLQHELFVLGADLATPPEKSTAKVRRVVPDDVARLEHDIDRLDAGLPELRAFILPSGTPTGSALHVARTVCRRAERLTVRLVREESLDRLPIIYLNRLADLLFVLARHVNHALGSPETPWKS